MSLTGRELQLMRDIERRLATEDPSFARRMTNPVTGRPAGVLSAGRPPGARTLVLMVAGALAYIVFSFLLVLTVAGSISMAAFAFLLAADLLGLLGVIAASRRTGSTGRPGRIPTSSPAAPGGLWRRRRRPGW